MGSGSSSGSSSARRSSACSARLDLSEENIKLALSEFREQATSMMGVHADAAAIGITGDVSLAEIDGPIVYLRLSGVFWHRRSTVMRNAGAFLLRRIPELTAVEPDDPDDLIDIEYDEETGEVLIDRRSPDFNGDRATLEYQGIDPDQRGPFAGNAGGFRAGGSMYT